MSNNDTILNDFEQKMRRDNLRLYAEIADSVVTASIVTRKIVRLAHSENTTISEMERVIECDQSLALKVVGVANSAYYGMSGRVRGISHAISLLGFNMIRSIAITLSIVGSLKKGLESDKIEALWLHSCKVARVSNMICGDTEGDDGTYFLTGLLHDVGRFLMYQAFRHRYVEMAVGSALLLTEAEAGEFGGDHAEVGAWLTGRLKFPEAIVRGIRYHHTPWPDHRISSIIYYADWLVSHDEEGSISSDCHTFAGHDDIVGILAVPSDVLRHIEEQFLSGEMENSVLEVFS